MTVSCRIDRVVVTGAVVVSCGSGILLTRVIVLVACGSEKVVVAAWAETVETTVRRTADALAGTPGTTMLRYAT
jgi:hypothetical protein